MQGPLPATRRVSLALRKNEKKTQEQAHPGANAPRNQSKWPGKQLKKSIGRQALGTCSGGPLKRRC